TSSTTSSTNETSTSETSTSMGPETTTDPAGAVADGSAVLRVAHLSPDAPAVDVYVDDRVVLEDVPFGAVSDYLVLDPGTYSVRVTKTGGDNAVFDQDVGVEANAYTAAALGEVSGKNKAFAVKLLTDDVEAPASGKARVRLVHAAPDAPAVDVTAKGDGVVFDGVAFGEASDYATVDAGDYTLQVRPATDANDGDVAATFDVTLDGGTVDTAFAVGYLNPGDAPADEAFDLLLTTDAGA
ncbi:MAG: DUF4397 domain-containing protein, partial [Halarchaeum sp.]